MKKIFLGLALLTSLSSSSATESVNDTTRKITIENYDKDGNFKIKEGSGIVQIQGCETKHGYTHGLTVGPRWYQTDRKFLAIAVSFESIDDGESYSGRYGDRYIKKFNTEEECILERDRLHYIYVSDDHPLVINLGDRNDFYRLSGPFAFLSDRYFFW